MLKLIEGIYLGKAKPESGGGGGSENVIEAINNTGATINADDKVYIAPLTTPQSGANYEIYPVQTSDTTMFGFVIGNGSQPRVDYTEKSIDSFNSNYYCIINKVMDFSQPWEFNICFETSSYVGGEQYLYFSNNNTYGTSGLIIQLYENKIYIRLVDNNNDLDVKIFHSYSVAVNTTYYVRIGWTGTQYYAKYSTDGTNWVDDVDSPFIFNLPAAQYSTGIAIGNRPSTSNYFSGKIFMDKTYMKSGDTIQWQMYSDIASNISEDLYIGIAGESIAAGSVGDVNIGGTGILPVIEGLNVTPTTSAQTITASGSVNGYSPINVAAVTAAIDENITSANIVDGVTILGVTGNVVELNGETINITPSTSQQIITPTSPANGITQATVAAVTAAIDNNIVASNIVSGVTILGVSGSATTLNGTTLSVTPSTSAQTLTPTSPNNGFTEVSVSAVTSSIDANITASNIKKDVVILGVTGSYEGTSPSGTVNITNNGIANISGYANAFVNVDRTVKANYYIDTSGTVNNLVMTNDVTLSGNATSLTTDNAFSAKFQNSSTLLKLDCSSLTTIEGKKVFKWGAQSCTSLTEVDFSSLISIKGINIFSYSFNGCTGLVKANFKSLQSIEELSNQTYMPIMCLMFEGCTSLIEIDFSNLTSIKSANNSPLSSLCSGCTSLPEIRFPKLNSIDANTAFNGFISGSSVADIYFNSLTTISFVNNSALNKMLQEPYNTTVPVSSRTVHFPSNLESTVQNLTGYPLFGGISGYVTLAFDLPATS